LRLVREELKERRGSEVYFDSGGFAIQQGKSTLEALTPLLLDCYTKYQWANWYVLPDWPPVAGDTSEDVLRKVRATQTCARAFWEKLPATIQTGILPVVQGHTDAQMKACLEMYAPFAPRAIGFGSIGTSGKNNETNRMDRKAVARLRTFLSLVKCSSLTAQIHLFGVSIPPLLYLLHLLGIESFDSSAWLKAAGFGSVFLPFVRGYAVTERSAGLRPLLSREAFEDLKRQTGHCCPFCEDYAVLTRSRMHRALHNLVTLHDTTAILSGATLDEATILSIIRQASPSYFRYYQQKDGVPCLFSVS